ncbi:HlyC/CorC family transporter [Terrarubrum flagellatum]|uniref:HlyC/CorC family transporter n=1 Tax=Terrirubrum flagellatum TaxID=2895980 RepID=UPI0031456EEC
MDELLVDNRLAALIVAGCLAVSASLSAIETSINVASRTRMLALEKAGDGRAAIVNRLAESRDRLTGAMMVGKTLVNIAAAAFVTWLMEPKYGFAGFGLAVVAMAILIIIFAEAAPRSLASARADALALRLARTAATLVAMLGPVFACIEFAVRSAFRLVGVRTDRALTAANAHEEIKGAIDLLHKEGGVVKSDRDMIGGLLDLHDLAVSDVMVHRTKMRAIDADQPPETIVREVLASPYTRMPLWRESPENIIGLLHAKDVLRALDAAQGDPAGIDLKAVTIAPWFVPDTTALHDQLRAFLQKKTHFAFVIDEYGVVMGLVTLEDVLEEIVGDIKDEHDVATGGVRPQRDGGVIVEGSTPIRDVNRAMDWSLPDDGPTTIAGLVIQEARMIPDASQVFTFHGFRFAVLRKHRNRITALRINPLPPPVSEQA